MAPRRAVGRQPTQHEDVVGPGPSSSNNTFPEFVSFTVAQTVFAEGCLPEADVKAMIRRLTQRTTDDAFAPVLKRIQEDMSYLELTIERVRFPVNNDWYICLVNKDADEAAKLIGSKYSVEQLTFFRAVVDALCSAQVPDDGLLGELSSVALVNSDVNRVEASQGGTQPAKRRKLDHEEKDRLIRIFARDGFLHTVRQGYYTLGPRTLGELKDLVLSAVPADVAERLKRDYM